MKFIKIFFLIASFCLLIYANSLGGNFVWDDWGFVAKNVYIRTLGNFVQFFTNPGAVGVGEFSNDMYRPVTIISYSLDYLCWRLNSFGYHLTNVLLHSSNSILVFLFLYLIRRNLFLALFGCLVFASHPVQAESVAWISSRSSVLFLFFYLLSLICYIEFLNRTKKIFYVISILSFALSLFSKEMSISLPLILVAYDLYFSKKEMLQKKFLRYAPYFLLAVLYVVLRTAVLGHIGMRERWGSAYDVFLTTSMIVTDYLKILFLPVKLCPIAYFVQPSTSIIVPRIFLSVVAILVLLACIPILFKRFRIISFSLSWFFITLLPVLNIFPIKVLKSDRYLYLPSVGFCLFLGFIASNIYKRLKDNSDKKAMVVTMIAASLIAAYSIMTVVRNNMWKDEIKIDRTLVAMYPLWPYALNALGKTYIKDGDYEGAIKPLEKAVRLSDDSNDYGSRHDLGVCYFRLGRYDKAIDEFVAALNTGEDSVETFNMLGVAYMAIKRFDEAKRQFMIALHKDPQSVDTLLNMGRLYEEKGDYPKALEQYNIILSSLKDKQNTAVAHIRIGDVYIKMRLPDKAKSHYSNAVEVTAGSDVSEMIKKIVADKLRGL